MGTFTWKKKRLMVMAAVIFLAGYSFGLNFQIPAPNLIPAPQLQNRQPLSAFQKDAAHHESVISSSKHLNEKILNLIESQKQTVNALENQINEQESKYFIGARQLDSLQTQMAQEQEAMNQLQLRSQMELTKTFSKFENNILEQTSDIVASSFQQDQAQQQMQAAQARVNQLTHQLETRRQSNIDYVDNDAVEAELEKSRQELALLQRNYYASKAQQSTASQVNENQRNKEKMSAEVSQSQIEHELNEHREAYQRMEVEIRKLAAQVQKDDNALSSLTDRYNEEMRKLKSLESAITNL